MPIFLHSANLKRLWMLGLELDISNVFNFSWYPLTSPSCPMWLCPLRYTKSPCVLCVPCVLCGVISTLIAQMSGDHEAWPGLINLNIVTNIPRHSDINKYRDSSVTPLGLHVLEIFASWESIRGHPTLCEPASVPGDEMWWQHAMNVSVNKYNVKYYSLIEWYLIWIFPLFYFCEKGLCLLEPHTDKNIMYISSRCNMFHWMKVLDKQWHPSFHKQNIVL